MKLPLTVPDDLRLPDWLQEPIYIGGDRYSENPGVMIKLTAHRVGNGFDIEIKPAHPDRPELAEHLLKNLVSYDNEYITYIGKSTIASGKFTTIIDRPYISGEGYLQVKMKR